jgi:hypothetical protein
VWAKTALTNSSWRLTDALATGFFVLELATLIGSNSTLKQDVVQGEKNKVTTQRNKNELPILKPQRAEANIPF